MICSAEMLVNKSEPAMTSPVRDLPAKKKPSLSETVPLVRKKESTAMPIITAKQLIQIK